MYRDGTLVTQRLHWAPTPHRYRHVLGWYRLVNELKSSDVDAVCVFDGPYRTTAKAMEVCLILVLLKSPVVTVPVDGTTTVRPPSGHLKRRYRGRTA